MGINKKYLYLRIIACILIQAVLFGNSGLIGVVRAENFLSPVLEINNKLVKTSFETPQVKSRRFVHNLDDLSKLSRRKRDDLEINVLKRIRNINLKGFNFLSREEQENFIFVDLDFAEYVLKTIFTDKIKEDMSQKNVSYEIITRIIVDMFILLNKVLEQQEGQDNTYIACTNYTFSKDRKGQTYVLTVNFEKKGVEAKISKFIAEEIDAEMPNIVSVSGPIEKITGNKSIDVSFYGVSKNNKVLTPSEITRAVKKLPPNAENIDISELRIAHKRLLNLARDRYEKQDILKEITPAIERKIKTGIVAEGTSSFTPITEKAFVGKIICAEVVEKEKKPTYPLVSYYSETLRKDLRLLDNAINTAMYKYEGIDINTVHHFLQDAFAFARHDSRETRKAPTAQFLSHLMDERKAVRVRIRKELLEIITYTPMLNKDNEPREISEIMEEELAELAELQDYEDNMYIWGELNRLNQEDLLWDNIMSQANEIVGNIYQYIEGVDPEPKNEKEQMALDAIENARKAVPTDTQIGSMVDTVLQDLPRQLFAWLRKYDCSLHEAFFRSMQPIVDQLVQAQEHTSQMKGGLSLNLHTELCTFVDTVLLELGEYESRHVVVHNDSEKEPFILYVPGDLGGPEEYLRFRRLYPNMVGIVVKEGAKHYAVMAGDHGFPVINKIDLIEMSEGKLPLELVLKKKTNGIMRISRGGKAFLYINPSLRDTLEAETIIKTAQAIKILCEANIDLEGEDGKLKTYDGVEAPEIMMNLDIAEDAEDLPSRVIRKIGLYRTEYEYERHGELTEEAWYKIFKKIVKDSEGDFIAVRLPDRKVSGEGGDIKNPKAFGKSNLEGLDFLLDERAKGRRISTIILRALMRVYAEDGVVGALFPMVSQERAEGIIDFVEEIKENLIFEQKNKNKREALEEALDSFSVGAMFETPQAFEFKKELMEIFDFVSWGSNDWKMASSGKSRGAQGTTKELISFTPEVVKTALAAGKMSRKKEVPFSICGKLASTPEFILFSLYAKSLSLFDIRLSVGKDSIAYVKEFIRHVDTRRIKDIFNDYRKGYDQNKFDEKIADEIENIVLSMGELAKPFLQGQVKMSLQKKRGQASKAPVLVHEYAI
ncbi:MAG: hypothetical protein GY853_00295 [PVC group bacterium]|nr:hypothetical protein [PVC group bacterium]